MKRPVAALSGGLAGTAVLSFLLLLLEVETREQVPVFDVIARFVGVPGEPELGFAIFVAAGIVAWPLVFVGLEPYIPIGRDPASRGLVLGGVLWTVFVVTGRGEIGFPLVIVYAGFTLFAHLIYGFTLGAVYARLLADDTGRATGRVEPRA